MAKGCHQFTPVFNRRQALRVSATGFGSLALASLLSESSDAQARSTSSKNPLAPRQPHFAPRVQRVIFLFMHGGPSQVDTFDYKPQLNRDHGKPLPFEKPRVSSAGAKASKSLLKSPWNFRQYGESGAWVSDLFPHTAKCVDDLCIINGMYGSNSRHGAALLELHTGSDTFVRPSMGSWITYGLGTENQDLPGYITICPTLTHGGVNAFSSAFLPAVYHGTPLGNASISSDQAKIPFIDSADATPRALQHLELSLLRDKNIRQLQETGPDDALEARINSFELAFRMQTTAPALQEINDETSATQKLYGLDNPKTKDFGRQCLMARRFAEQGVRFIQCSHSYKWDQHGNLQGGHTNNAMEVDQPISALLVDLKERGLLDDTLVIWGGEFGRTPLAEGTDGRDHNPQGYTMWLAGGGIKRGIRYGETDEYGYFAVKNKVHLHDLHATILHLFGLDHEKLVYYHAGRDFSLTDIHGEVVHDILA